MTNEQAIRHLEDLQRLYLGNEKFTADIEAIGIAIKALEQEPCEDCISRKAELDGLASIAKAQAKSDAQKALMGRVMYFTEQLPPVIPKYTDEEIDRAQAVEQAYIDKMVELVAEEAKRPKGKWISHREHCENLGAIPNGLGAYQWCSNCDCAIDIREWQRNHYNFCPNCGADMRESEDKE